MRGAAVVMPAAPRFVSISLNEQDYAAGGRQGVGASKKAWLQQARRLGCKKAWLQATQASKSRARYRHARLLITSTLLRDLRHSRYATLGVRLRELRWKNSA
jgi:hypothetical protein